MADVRALVKTARTTGVTDLHFGDFAWIVAKVPGQDAIRLLVVRVAMVVDVALARELERLLAIHDGQVVRLDGHFKLQRHVKRYVWGRRKRKYAAAGGCLLNSTGTTGFMQRRNRLVGKEKGDTFSETLRDIAGDRIQWALGMAIIGVDVPNDGLFAAVLLDADRTYKHRLRRELAMLFPSQTVLLQDAGPGVSREDAVEIGGSLRVIPLEKCIVGPDAKYISLNVQKCVLCSVVDAEAFKSDVNDAIMRWSWARPSELHLTPNAPDAHIWSVVDLSEAGRALMLRLVEGTPGPNVAMSEVRAFLSEPWCQASPVWAVVFPERGAPPRRTLQRIADRAGATLHETCGAHGWESAEDYIQEVCGIVHACVCECGTFCMRMCECVVAYFVVM